MKMLASDDREEETATAAGRGSSKREVEERGWRRTGTRNNDVVRGRRTTADNSGRRGRARIIIISGTTRHFVLGKSRAVY